MNPWNIIGWIILAIGASWAIWTLGHMLLSFSVLAAMWLRHFWTRNTPPSPDQLWLSVNSSQRYRIERVVNGRIVSCASYGTLYDTPEDWKLRVRGHRLFLA